MFCFFLGIQDSQNDNGTPTPVWGLYRSRVNTDFLRVDNYSYYKKNTTTRRATQSYGDAQTDSAPQQFVPTLQLHH